MTSMSLDYLAASFELHLRAEGKSAKTVRIYLTAPRHFAAWAQDRYPDLSDWQAVRRDHLRQWSAETIESSSAGNASVQWRGLQQFLKWAEFEGEVDKNPMRGLAGPQVTAPLVPVIELDQLRALLATVAGNSFIERRDNAILRLLIDTGIRRGELVAQLHRHLADFTGDLRLRRLLLVLLDEHHLHLERRGVQLLGQRLRKAMRVRTQLTIVAPGRR